MEISDSSLVGMWEEQCGFCLVASSHEEKPVVVLFWSVSGHTVQALITAGHRCQLTM